MSVASPVIWHFPVAVVVHVPDGFDATDGVAVKVAPASGTAADVFAASFVMSIVLEPWVPGTSVNTTLIVCGPPEKVTV